MGRKIPPEKIKTYKEMIAQGATNKTIAAKTGLSIRTIQNWRASKKWDDEIQLLKTGYPEYPLFDDQVFIYNTPDVRAVQKLGTTEAEKFTAFSYSYDEHDNTATFTDHDVKTIVENFKQSVTVNGEQVLTATRYGITGAKLFNKVMEGLRAANAYSTVDNFIIDIVIDLPEYAEERDIKPTKQGMYNLKQQIKNDLSFISSIKLTVPYIDNDGTERARTFRIVATEDLPADIADDSIPAEGFTLKGKELRLRINPDYVKYLVQKGQVTKISTKYYALQSPVAEKLYPQMNSTFYIQAPKAQLKGGYAILTMSKLLEYCESVLPNAEWVKGHNRNYKERIIDPITHALTELSDRKMVEWEYCNPKGEPLTDEQICFQDSWEYFKDFRVKYRITGERTAIKEVEVEPLREADPEPKQEAPAENTTVTGVRLKKVAERYTVTDLTDLEKLKQDVEALTNAPTREDYVKLWGQQIAKLLEPYIEGRVKDVSGEDFEQDLLSKVKGWDGRHYSQAYYVKAGKAKEIINNRLMSIEAQIKELETGDTEANKVQRGQWIWMYYETKRAYNHIQNSDDDTNVLVFEDSFGIPKTV